MISNGFGKVFDCIGWYLSGCPLCGGPFLVARSVESVSEKVYRNEASETPNEKIIGKLP